MMTVLRSQDILVVLKIQALDDAKRRESLSKEGNGTAFGEPEAESKGIETKVKFGLAIPFSELGASLGISASQAFTAAQRAKEAALLRPDYSVRSTALLETLLAISHYLPAKRGGLARGIPTAHAALPLSQLIQPDDEPIPVWQSAEGKVRGLICEPIYKTAPQAALEDPILYEYLALVDALRIGRAREINNARSELQRRLEGTP